MANQDGPQFNQYLNPPAPARLPQLPTQVSIKQNLQSQFGHTTKDKCAYLECESQVLQRRVQSLSAHVAAIEYAYERVQSERDRLKRRIRRIDYILSPLCQTLFTTFDNGTVRANLSKHECTTTSNPYLMDSEQRSIPSSSSPMSLKEVLTIAMKSSAGRPQEHSNKVEDGSTEVVFAHENLQISVPEGFSCDRKILLGCQKTAIDNGCVYEVSIPTRIYIVGWLKKDPRMACVQVVLPPTTQEEFREMPYGPICLVKKGRYVVAGVVIVPMKACFQLAPADRLIDLSQLEEAYKPLLARLDENRPKFLQDIVFNHTHTF